jgi:GT2 family glycosyltransferase
MSHAFDAPREGVLKEVAYVPGTAALIRNDVFRRAGLLDERYFFGGELADLCERAHGFGWRSIIHAQTRALHDVARSSQLRDSLHAYYVIRNRFLFIRKFRKRQRMWLFAYWSVYGWLMSAAALLRGNRRRARALRLGVWHGLTQSYGGRNREVWPELKATS